MSTPKEKSKYSYSSWHKDSIELFDGEYHILDDGILTKKDYAILFDNEKKKLLLPPEITETINIYSYVDFSKGFLQEAFNNSIDINVFDPYGGYLGSFFAASKRNRTNALIAQIQIVGNETQRLKYAKKLEGAFLHNLICNLQYYNKHISSELLTSSIKEIQLQMKNISKAKTISRLMIYEAKARLSYYCCFSDIISNDKFSFTKRTKRPPKDEINAMISLGNVFLYQKLSSMIHKSTLENSLSFVHSAQKRSESLCLDLADIFKPIIVDKVIFTLVNKKMINPTKHFCKKNGGVYLNAAGKKLFIENLNKKLLGRITVDEERYTYEQLMMQEVKKLEASITKGTAYKPYKHRV